MKFWLDAIRDLLPAGRKALFCKLETLQRKLLMNQAELAQSLTDLGTQLTKASAEITGKITELEAAIGNAGTVSPQVEAALNALKASGQALDNIVPDAAPV